MKYLGNVRFNLAATRHTGERIGIFLDLAPDECPEASQPDPWFQPCGENRP